MTENSSLNALPAEPSSLDTLQAQIQTIINADTDDFFELADMLGRDPLRDLAGANLSGTDLHNGNLSGADLRRTILREANLHRANISGADLTQADLQGANLREANLRGANLNHANLSNANLDGADFSGANLSQSNLNNANLNNANLRGVNLNDANLSDADLDGADLSGADLNNANVDKTDFRQAIVDVPRFSGHSDLPAYIEQRGASIEMSHDSRQTAPLDKKNSSRARKVLSQADESFLRRLQAIDFGPIAFKLMNLDEGTGLTLEQTIHGIELYRKFLFLTYCYPERQIVPSREIDRVWHVHILDTAKYREDCNMLFGHFTEHWPYAVMGDAADLQAQQTAFAETQKLFEQHFGSEALAFAM